MSNVIDERVVEMRFDNKHFESNVQTSLSTLDKLKQALNLSKSAKGLESVGAAAKNVNLAPLGTAVESVQAKFSALQVIGITALSNITNSAVNAGKRIVSALTIDPIKTGFSEYETKINAIQTIMSNTASKGTTMEDVTRVIDELNTYADKTIYNFSEMTRNIGTFTAAGVGLEKSAAAIQGIANLAAASGSNSQQASTAMYQLSQALAAGTVKLMDWNSVVNAGMGGEKFQEALKQTAREMGISVDSIIEKNGSFRDSLHEGWITADVLNTTLQKFTQEGAAEYADAMVKSGKYTKEQADALKKEAKSMEEAATKVKTFTQLWDTLKESAQSGWSKTWELIIGDFDEAKTMLTGLSDVLGGFINRMSDWRNNILEGALDISKPWTSITEKLEGAGLGKIKQVAETVGDLTDKLEYYQDVVNKVWRGDYKNSDTGRFEKLDADGYDHRVVQDLVNKGYQYKLTVEDIEESHKKFGLTMDKSTEKTKGAAKEIGKLSDEQLRNAGLTEDEIDLYRALEKEADKAGISIGELADKMSKNDGRSLLLDSFKNAANGLKGIGVAIKDAWVDIFDPPGVGELAVKLYGIITTINEFSKNLRMVNDETGELNGTGKKLQRTFKGVFALIDIIATVMGGGFKIAFNVVKEILSYFNLDILDVTASIGDALVKFRDWTDSCMDLSGVLDVVVPWIKDAASVTGEWFDKLKGTEAFSNFVDLLSTAGESILDWMQGIKDAENVPQYIISGLINGLKAGVSAVWDAALEIGKAIVESVCDFLGIQSPSTVFFAIGGFIIAGLVNGLLSGKIDLDQSVTDILDDVINHVVEFTKNIKDKITKLDFSKLLAAGLFVGMLFTVTKVANVLENITSPLEGLGDMFEGIGQMTKNIGKGFKFGALALLGVALTMLASVVTKLAEIPPGDLWSAVGAVTVLGLVLVGLSFLMSKIDALGNISVKDIAIVIAISGALFILATAIGKLSSITGEDIPKILGILSGMIIGLGAFALAMKGLGKASEGMSSVGSMLLKMSVALLIMVGVMKLISMMDDDDVFRGLAVVAAIELLFIAVIAVSKLAGENASKAGSMLLKMSLALLIMVGVIRLVSLMDENDIFKGLIFIAAVEALAIGLVAVSILAGKNASKAGSMLLKMSAAMLIMTLVIKQISSLSESEIERGMGVVVTISALFTALIAVSLLAGENASKAGVMLLSMSAAMLILAGVLFIISQMDPEGVRQALGVVTVLELLFIGLVAVSKNAENAKGSLIVMTIAIALLAGAVIAMSFIDAKSLATASACLTAVIGVFALLVQSTKAIKKPEGMIVTLLSLLGVVSVLAGIVLLLGQVEAESALPNCAALSLLMVAFASALTIISKAGPFVSTASKAMLPMLGVVAGLAVVLGLMSALNVEASMPSAIALSILLTAMSGALVILGYTSVMAPIGVKALGPMLLIVLGVAAILGVLAALEVTPSIETAAAISLLLLGMSGVLAILSLIGPMAAGADIAMVALGKLIIGVGALLGLMGGFITLFPEAEEFIDKGIPLLEKIGSAIGSFFGNIVSGFIDSASLGMLSTISGELSAFVEGLPTVDPAIVDSASNIAKMILTLTAANLLDSISQFIGGGGSSLTSFASQLQPFGEAMVAFSSTVSGNIDEGAVTAAANAGKVIAEMASSIPKTGGWAQNILGESDMAKFGAQVRAYGRAIVDFSGVVSQEGAINETAITAARNAGMLMVELADAIPKTGGWAQMILGESDMAAFGAQLRSYGRALVDFSSVVSQEGAINETAITAAKNAGLLMTELSDAIPKSDGWAQNIMGESNMATFGKQIVKFGEAIVDFSSTVSQEGAINETAITAAQNAGLIMAQLQEAIPEDKWFDGKVSMDDFGKDIKKFGKYLAEYSEKVVDIDNGAVTNSIKAAEDLVDLSRSMVDLDMSGVEDFKIKDLGKALKKYSDEVSDIGDISSSISSARRLLTLIKDMAGLDSSGVDAFSSALASLGEVNIDTFVESFSSASSKLTEAGSNLIESLVKGVKSKKYLLSTTTSDVLNHMQSTISDRKAKFSNLGSDVINMFAKGLTSGKAKVSTAITASIATAITSARGHYMAFYNAGSYLVSGFASGISANTYKAAAKASAMATAAKEAAEEALDINSPSKVFRTVGMAVPEGFAMGIDKLRGMVTNSSVNMTSAAVDGVRSSISRIADIVSTDIDTQPTIRPVLDLSDVRSSAGSIGSILGMGTSVGVMANVGTISSMMNRYNQNGGNAEVVSAINKLRGELSNISGDTYQVGDITYDDGSNITSAVQSLVRAAKIERRT